MNTSYVHDRDRPSEGGCYDSENDICRRASTIYDRTFTYVRTRTGIYSPRLMHMQRVRVTGAYSLHGKLGKAGGKHCPSHRTM